MVTGNKLMNNSRAKSSTIFIVLMFTAYILKIILITVAQHMNVSQISPLYNHKLTLAKHAI